jgi:hypothetical protein
MPTVQGQTHRLVHIPACRFPRVEPLEKVYPPCFSFPICKTQERPSVARHHGENFITHLPPNGCRVRTVRDDCKSQRYLAARKKQAWFRTHHMCSYLIPTHTACELGAVLTTVLWMRTLRLRETGTNSSRDTGQQQGPGLKGHLRLVACTLRP